jgi:hypothetical protein
VTRACATAILESVPEVTPEGEQVEIKSPLLKRCICQVDFDLTGRYFSSVGDMLHVALRDKRQWNELKINTREQSYTVQHKDRRQWLFLEPKRVRYMCNSPKNGDETKKYIVELFDEIATAGKLDNPTRIGSRNGFLLFVTGAKFGEIEERFRRTFLSEGLSKSLHATGLTPNDTGLIFDFEHNGYTAHLEIGPLSREQLAQRFGEPETTAFPKLSYLVDLDYAANRNVIKQFPDISTVIAESLNRGEALSAKLFNQLKGQSK